MAQPFSLENTLRIHDEAVYGWFGGLIVDYGTVSGVARNQVGILRVMATPDRAWADLSNILVSQNWIAGATDQDKRDNVKLDFDTLPLPFASIERSDPQTYFDGGGVPKRFRRQAFVGDTQKWEEHGWPGSYRIEYRVTLWSNKKYSMAWMQEWVFSQLGKLGAAEHEVFLNVAHAAPWGTIKQALRFDGATDVSELEGERPRYIRSEFSFTLNMLHFRPPTNSSPVIDTLVTAVAFEGDPRDEFLALEDLTGVDLAPATASGNLYQPYYTPPLIPTRWPKAGDATVANSTITPDDRVDRGALLVTVEDPADQVDVLNRPITIDMQGVAVLSYAFQYVTDAPVDLDLQQHDGSNLNAPAWTRMDLQRLPAMPEWSRVHGFSVVTQPIFDLALIGTGQAATLRIANVRVKHIHSGTKVSPTSSSVVGSENRRAWTGLTAGMYLVIVTFTSAVASGTVTVENDGTSPTYTKTDAIDTTKQRSSVFLIQPAGDSLVVRVPVALTIAAVYLQRYDGGYGGNDV